MARATASAYVWSEKESRKQKAARKKSEREAQANEEETFRQALEEDSGGDLSRFPLSSEIRLPIREGCAGLLIGKKGEHIRSVEKRFKVNIKVQDDISHSSLEGVAGCQEVVISGLLPEQVQDAARELDIVADTMELASDLAGWAMGKGGKHLKMIKELSGVSVLNLLRSGGAGNVQEDEDLKTAIKEVVGPEKTEGAIDAAAEFVDVAEDAPTDDTRFEDFAPGEQCWLEIKGKRERVEDARLLLAAHLGYHQIYVEMREAETSLEQEIAQARSLLGRSRREPMMSSARRAASGTATKAAGKGAPGLPEPSSDTGKRGYGAEIGGKTKGRGRGRGRGLQVSN